MFYKKFKILSNFLKATLFHHFSLKIFRNREFGPMKRPVHFSHYIWMSCILIIKITCLDVWKRITKEKSRKNWGGVVIIILHNILSIHAKKNNNIGGSGQRFGLAREIGAVETVPRKRPLSPAQNPMPQFHRETFRRQRQLQDQHHKTYSYSWLFF